MPSYFCVPVSDLKEVVLGETVFYHDAEARKSFSLVVQVVEAYQSLTEALEHKERLIREATEPCQLCFTKGDVNQPWLVLTADHITETPYQSRSSWLGGLMVELIMGVVIGAVVVITAITCIRRS